MRTKKQQMEKTQSQSVSDDTASRIARTSAGCSAASSECISRSRCRRSASSKNGTTLSPSWYILSILVATGDGSMLTRAVSEQKKDKVDYVNANAWEVIKKSPPKDMGPEQRRVRNANFGRIPKYLLERKEQWAREEDERRRTAPDPDCPKGMVLLDEDERVRTLHVLCQSLEEARLRMNRLPLHVETLSQVRRKAELEDKLREIEDAIRVFDRPKVYVTKPADADGGAARGRRSNNSSRVSAAA